MSNPYVGPRPFTRKETLYGRDEEAAALAQLLSNERLVVLYSPSGAGKTSLINTALHKNLVKPEGSEYERWLEPVGAIFRDLKQTDVRFRRIVSMHALLNAFIEETDPKHLRTRPLDYHWDLLSSTEKDQIQDLLA